MNSIHDLLPDPEILLELAPEDLAGHLIEYLNYRNEKQLNRYNYSLSCADEYPSQYKKPVSEALMEAWSWLEHEGMIAPKPASQGEWVFITRRGRKVRKAKDLETYQRAKILPRALLHPTIAIKISSDFHRGDYDSAVLKAFKEVEVAVRNAASLCATDIGVSLMRKAFDPDSGSLTDSSEPKAEREALSHLFSGAIGSYKNPSSHRHVTLEPEEAVEMLILASHLLRIVDSRIPVDATQN